MLLIGYVFSIGINFGKIFENIEQIEMINCFDFAIRVGSQFQVK